MKDYTMNKTFAPLLGLILMAVALCSCGGLRYSQSMPDAKNFHPGSVAVLPASVGVYEKAHGVIDDIVADVVNERGWFDRVSSARVIEEHFKGNGEAEEVVTGYIAKLETVNFSDPDLSNKIGEMFSAEAFLVVRVEFWNYTVKDKNKVAKVGIGMDMVEAKTGKIMWQASHYEIKYYWLIKPDLSDLARKVAAKMSYRMPH